MADAKDAARGSRLSMESKKRHLDELYRYALKKCDDKAAGTSFFYVLSLSLPIILIVLTTTTAFAKCAKEQGWMVVFRCREENRKLNKCLEQYTNEEKREEWLRAKGCEP